MKGNKSIPTYLPLIRLFRASLDEKKPLEEPYTSQIIPVLKPNKNKHDPASYRRISPCSQVVKVME